MDFFDILQYRDIRKLQENVEQERVRNDLAQWDNNAKIKELTQENLELKLRLGFLVKLLITKGVISAEEYAALLVEGRSGS